MILYSIVCSSRQHFSNHGPSIPKSFWVKISLKGIYILCASIKARSSSSVQRFLLIIGFRWLNQRSLHCLPILPTKYFAISLHFLGPFFETIFLTISSSSFVHGPLVRFGFSTFYHLCRHCTSVLSLKKEATFFQFLGPYCLTIVWSFKS